MKNNEIIELLKTVLQKQKVWERNDILTAFKKAIPKEINPKIIIKVQGGMVEETISTTKDVVINIADYDGIRTSEKDDLFTHWNCEADRIVSDEEFKKLADDMDHNFKVSFK